VTFVLDPSRSTSNGVKVKEVTIGFSEATAGATNTPVIRKAETKNAFIFI
jgi:pyruvate/2-oxoglutarate dehydrogenase complex dihydrolipoamide acyltransferase (E2) component